MTDDDETQTTTRKRDHVDIILDEDVEASHNAWDEITFVHDALPEVDHGAVDLSTSFLGHDLSAPLMVASMTGGYPDGEAINDHLAEAAAAHGLGMGVGSQRAALDDPETASTYGVVRDHDLPFVAANIGAPQLVEQPGEDAFTREEIDTVVSMVEADALVVHLNYLQEAVQPEGDLRAEGVRAALHDLAHDLDLPVIAKETGAGIDRDAARRLRDAGVDAIDVGGLSGTTFSAVEGVRAKDAEMESRARLGALFRDWGVPTPVSVRECHPLGVPLVATGGLSSGLDVARGVALGAEMTGMASAALHAADRGEADAFLDQVLTELRTALFLTGSRTVDDLVDVPLVVVGETAAWLERLGHDPADLGRGRRMK